jgi:hypothetical protein
VHQPRQADPVESQLLWGSRDTKPALSESRSGLSVPRVDDDGCCDRHRTDPHGSTFTVAKGLRRAARAPFAANASAPGRPPPRIRTSRGVAHAAQSTQRGESSPSENAGSTSRLIARRCRLNGFNMSPACTRNFRKTDVELSARSRVRKMRAIEFSTTTACVDEARHEDASCASHQQPLPKRPVGQFVKRPIVESVGDSESSSYSGINPPRPEGRMSVRLSSMNLRHSSLVPEGPSALHPTGITACASQIENKPSSLTSTNQTASEPAF